MPPIFRDSGEPEEMVPKPPMKKPTTRSAATPKKQMKKPAAVKKTVTKKEQPKQTKEAKAKGPIPTVEETLRVIKNSKMSGGNCDVAHDPTKLSVGSACSGWCSELFALWNLGIPFVSCFGCDNDTACRAISRSVHDHHLWYDDVTGTEFKKAPKVDFFFAGFPCQPFSTAGLRKGIHDTRGDIIFYLLCCLAYEPKPCKFDGMLIKTSHTKSLHRQLGPLILR